MFDERQLAYILADTISFTWVAKDILEGEVPSRPVMADMLWHAVHAKSISIQRDGDFYTARAAISPNREAVVYAVSADRAVLYLLPELYQRFPLPL